MLSFFLKLIGELTFRVGTGVWADLSKLCADVVRLNYPQNLSKVESPAADIDLTASTDGEDLFVFASDVLEFTQQDVYLLWDACGEGLLVAGLAAVTGGLGLFVSKKLLAGRRLK